MKGANGHDPFCSETALPCPNHCDEWSKPSYAQVIEPEPEPEEYEEDSKSRYCKGCGDLTFVYYWIPGFDKWVCRKCDTMTTGIEEHEFLVREGLYP